MTSGILSDVIQRIAGDKSDLFYDPPVKLAANIPSRTSAMKGKCNDVCSLTEVGLLSAYLAIMFWFVVDL